MVIINNIEEKDRQITPEVGNQYVYLVDNEQQMMLILKRDIEGSGGKYLTGESAPVQEFIVGKVHSLLDRITGNGPLSLREMEVLNYAAMGKSNKQIAKIMSLSESTVKNHFSSMLRKLHANDRTHAVTLALCNGWLNAKNISSGFMEGKTVIRAMSGN